MKYKELSNGDLFSGIGNSSVLTNKTTILMKISNTYSIVVQSSLVTLVGSLVSMLHTEVFEEVNFETKFTIPELAFPQFGHYDDDIYIKIKESDTYICCYSKDDTHLTWLNTYAVKPLDTFLVSGSEVVCQISEIEGF